jgi:dephospho-CoA kinase
MKVIAIGGEPGSGKSTLMNRLLDYYNPIKKYNEVKLVPYLQKNDIYFLGKYDEGEVFSGTDKMSMAVQPEAIKFLSTLSDNSVVLYEGDRLFTSSFLENCAEKYDLNIIYLETHKQVRKDRYSERGSNQNETWLSGRETKIANILSNLSLLFHIEKHFNNTYEEQEEVFKCIMELIDDKRN